MAVQDILQGLMPLSNTLRNSSSALLNDPRMQNAFNIAAQGQAYRNNLDRQLATDKAQMIGGAAMQIASPAVGLLNPMAGGAMFGAGHGLMNQKPGLQVAGEAAGGALAAGATNKLMGAVNSAMANRVGTPGVQLSSKDQLLQQLSQNKFGSPLPMTKGIEPLNPQNAALGTRLPYPGQSGFNPSAPTPTSTPQLPMNVPQSNPITSTIPQAQPGGNMIPNNFTQSYGNSIGLPQSPALGGQFGAVSAPGESLAGGAQGLLNAEGAFGGGVPSGFGGFLDFAGNSGGAINQSLQDVGQAAMRGW